MVEQNFHFAAPLADRFYVMEHGQIVEHFEASQLNEKQDSAQRPAGRFRSLCHPPDNRQTLQEGEESSNEAAYPYRRAGAGRSEASPGAGRPGARSSPTMSSASASLPICRASTPTSTARPAWKPSSMAIEDAGGTVNGKKIELVSADHQNKADVGLIAGARMVRPAARGRADRRHQLRHQPGHGGGRRREEEALHRHRRGRLDLTNAQCTPYTVHYAYDTVALARGTGSAVVKDGGKSWFFLTADYAFGHALERDTANVVKAAGGEVKGQVRRAAGRIGLLVLPAAGAGLRRRRSWAWPTPAAIRSTRSRRPTSSASRRP